MRIVYAILLVILLGGCVSSIHKERIECIHQINQSERVMDRGNKAIELGNKTVLKGKTQYDKAKHRLEELM